MSVYAQEYGYFFNSNNSDRKYNAESFEEWLKPFFVSGVFTGGLQVTAQDTPDMSVKVSAGYANLDGKAARWTESNTLTLETASGVYSRIDTIVLRRDNTNRSISIEVVKGTASASPQPTAPTRNSDIFELVIAQILVGVGVTEIVASKITDKRMDSSVCGYVAATVNEIDFDQILAQFEGWMTEQTDYFDAWFEAIRGQLDEDAAGHLQNEVDDTQAMIADPYNQDTVYAAGDKCTHSGKLYEHNSWGSDTPAAEAWDADHWTENQVMDKLDAEATARAVADTALETEISKIQGEIGYVVNGKQCANAVSIGKYVILKNSTISGKSDGLYTAAKAIPASTNIDGTYLTAVSAGGGLNSLNDSIANSENIPSTSFTKSNSVTDFSVDYAKKYNKLVTFTVIGKINSRYGNLCTIASNIRPGGLIICSAKCTVGGYDVPSYASLSSSGTIYVVNPTGAENNNAVTVTATYIIP